MECIQPARPPHLHSEAIMDVGSGCRGCQGNSVSVIVFRTPPPIGVEKNLRRSARISRQGFHNK
eukprot:3189472-Rhodomonas_salina.3